MARSSLRGLDIMHSAWLTGWLAATCWYGPAKGEVREGVENSGTIFQCNVVVPSEVRNRVLGQTRR